MDIEKLRPFLQYKRRRSRVILFLLVSDYSVSDICDFTLGQLKSLRDTTVDDIRLSIDEVLEDSNGSDDDLAFTYPNGRAYTVFDIRRILHDSTKAVTGKVMSQTEFSNHITHQ